MIRFMYVVSTGRYSSEWHWFQLHGNLHVHVTYVTLYLDRNTDYMAFGLSGSSRGINMIGSDVVVCDSRENQGARAVDYQINSYSQVRK